MGLSRPLKGLALGVIPADCLVEESLAEDRLVEDSSCQTRAS